MLEKLVPGDRVMKIPAKGDDFEPIVPYGAFGVVLEGEGNFPCRNIHTNQTSIKYGCLVDFEKHRSPHGTGRWFVVRDGLMKITPDEKLIEEETGVIKEDSLPPLLTIDQISHLFDKTN